jgi:hypothetical protein
MLVLKLRCNKHSASTVRPTPPLVEEEAPFLKKTTYMSRRKKYLGQKSRRDLKTRMAVLARASSNLTDQQNYLSAAKNRV